MQEGAGGSREGREYRVSREICILMKMAVEWHKQGGHDAVWVVVMAVIAAVVMGCCGRILGLRGFLWRCQCRKQPPVTKPLKLTHAHTRTLVSILSADPSRSPRSPKRILEFVDELQSFKRLELINDFTIGSRERGEPALKTEHAAHVILDI